MHELRKKSFFAECRDAAMHELSKRSGIKPFNGIVRMRLTLFVDGIQQTRMNIE